MSKLTSAFLALFISLFFISCQKESGNDLPPQSADNIQGNYQFISVSQTSHVTQQVTTGDDVEKMVTVATFTSTKNSGTLKIDAATMSSNNITYTANTMAKGYYYYNGSLEDSTDAPFAFTVPASSATATYKMVGSDSVYFSSGTMFANGITQPTQPVGAKLKVEGNKLYITQSIDQSATQNVQGETVVTHTQLTGVILLQKL